MDKQLQEALNDGSLISGYLDGTAQVNKIATEGVVDTKVAVVDDKVTATDTKVDGLISGDTPVIKAVFTPQGLPPDHTEGTFFYDEIRKTFVGYNDQTDVSLNIGEEILTPIWNKTGATLLNGVPVRSDKTTTNGISNAVLAQADTFSNAVVAGVTTMDIPNGTKGYITLVGSVGGVDLSSFTVGDTLYLREDIAGEYVTVAPDIATRVGLVAVAEVDGTLLVNPYSNMVLPTIYGSMHDGSTVTSFVADTYYPIAVYDVAQNDEVGIVLDDAAGTINVPITGKYRLTANIVINFGTIGNAKEDLFLGIYDGTSIVKEIKSFLGKDSEAGAFYPSIIVELEANKSYSLQIKSSFALSAVSYSLASFDVVSVHIRA